MCRKNNLLLVFVTVKELYFSILAWYYKARRDVGRSISCEVDGMNSTSANSEHLDQTAKEILYTQDVIPLLFFSNFRDVDI